jgi:DNA-binding GntR family transcriptional regulator
MPFYRQLADILREGIASGRLGPEHRLATEFELMERFGVSRTTVRQTIAVLQKERLIAVHRGKGTSVATRTLGPDLSALTGVAQAVPVSFESVFHFEQPFHRGERIRYSMRLRRRRSAP